MMEDEVVSVKPTEPLMPTKKGGWQEKVLPVLVVLVIIAAGTGTGYFLSSRQAATGPGSQAAKEAKERIKKGMVFGVDDSEVFRDTAQGVVEVNDGSLTDEGTHKLIREGGESQTAYLISSVLDLDKFLDRKVKIWGETFAAQKAGWLLDVGRVEVLE